MNIRTTTNRVCLPIIFMFLLVLVSSRAEAKGLLMFDLPTQYVDFHYSIQNSNNNTSQRITPSYGLSVPFAILDPTFLTGNFGGSINYSMGETSGASGQSSSSSEFGYRYNVGGILLKETAHPINFFANSTETTSQQDFSPTSTVTNDAYGINGIIKSKTLPMTYSVRHDDTKTDNATSSFETVQDIATFIITHKISNLMSTSVHASYQQTKNTNSVSQANTATDLATAELTNTLQLYNINKWLGTLSTNLYIQEATGSFPIETKMLTESYSGSLGKGLLLGGSYSVGRTVTTLQTQQVKAGQGFVEHRLFDSLRTRITGSFNDTVNSTGEGNSNTSWTAQVNYMKKLPLNAVLQLEASDGITVRDSKLNGSPQTQLNEQITIDDISKLFPLQNLKVIRIIEVRDNSTNQLYVARKDNPAAYDYDTLLIGQTTFITINPAGAIHTNTVIVVTYEYQSDPSIKYSTNTISGSASYTLFNGRYLFQALYSESSSTLLSGGRGAFAPPETRLFRAAARANLVNLMYGVEYRASENFSTKQDTFEGFVYYYKMVDRNNYGLQVSDSYNTYSPTGTAGFGTTGDLVSNSLNIGLNWSRPLFLTGRMLLTMNYQMVRGTLPGRDYLSTRFAYDLPLGKFSLHLDASSVLRIVEAADTTTNNSVNISLRRYF